RRASRVLQRRLRPPGTSSGGRERLAARSALRGASLRPAADGRAELVLARHRPRAPGHTIIVEPPRRLPPEPALRLRALPRDLAACQRDRPRALLDRDAARRARRRARALRRERGRARAHAVPERERRPRARVELAHRRVAALVG